jgi:hypothetical protein
MNDRERAEYRDDGLSGERREQFLISERLSRQWQERHAGSLDDYFDFLETLQEMFEPFPQRHEVWRGNDFRL